MKMNNLFENLIFKPQNKILCLAKNYLKHALEMGHKDVPPYPVVFGKPWSSLTYEPNSVKIKTKEGHNIDHEGMLINIH
jgi:2-keto-4-pentenoate hydratase/2-oxohepta-3-ene-1,7-dioic acid hydratase in catechol pathway